MITDKHGELAGAAFNAKFKAVFQPMTLVGRRWAPDTHATWEKKEEAKEEKKAEEKDAGAASQAEAMPPVPP